MVEFFRDDTLSDLIGFTYATWHGDDAAHNLVNELAHLARQYAESDASAPHAVLIALDGENAWEHYPFNGYYFLRALYSLLAAHPQLELTTLSDCVARGLEPAAPAERAWPAAGCTARSPPGWAIRPRTAPGICSARPRSPSTASMAAGALDAAAAGRGRAPARPLCESSDWFWWFGDYNPADAVSQFDSLYRRQLVVLYRLLGSAAAGEPRAADFRRPRQPRARRRHAARLR